jgi:hypothetical protein
MDPEFVYGERTITGVLWITGERDGNTLGEG